MRKKNIILSKNKKKIYKEKFFKIYVLWIDYYGVFLGMFLIMFLIFVCFGCDVLDIGSKWFGIGSFFGYF